jgi:acyl carrier protein
MESRVKQIMNDILGIDPDMIDDFTQMDRTAAWDSSNHINLCLSLEEEFNVTLSVSDIETMVSYSEILKVLRSKQ